MLLRPPAGVLRALAIRALCLVLLAAAPGAAAGQPVKSDQEAIIELERAWNRAFYDKDLKFLDSILADEFVATYDDGSRGDKARELKLAAEFNQAVLTASQEDFSVKIFGDTAVVWFTLKVVGLKQGQPSELALRYTDVWVYRDGRWRCVSAHSTRVPAPK